MAAGVGRRMGQDKVLLRLRDKPLFLYTVDALAQHPEMGHIVVVTREDIRCEVQNAVDALSAKNQRVAVIAGGQQRYDSVWNGLSYLLENHPPELVLIQDGARPFLSQGIISQSIGTARDFGAACVAVRSEDTLKSSADGVVIQKTIDRSLIWRAQTPQTFRFSLLVECFQRLKREGGLEDVTDDASILERCGHQVWIVPGDIGNIKVTHPLDLKIAEALLDSNDPTN